MSYFLFRAITFLTGWMRFTNRMKVHKLIGFSAITSGSMIVGFTVFGMRFYTDKIK